MAKLALDHATRKIGLEETLGQRQRRAQERFVHPGSIQ
jgi:hypothetical protein